MDLEKSINFMASLNHSVSRTMDRLHIMIGVAIPWAVVICGFMLAIGWEENNPIIIFWIANVPVIASYIALLHFDRRYHKFETINSKIMESAQRMVMKGSDIESEIEKSLMAFSNTCSPSWISSLRHMTFGPYGLVYGTLIFTLVISALVK